MLNVGLSNSIKIPGFEITHLPIITTIPLHLRLKDKKALKEATFLILTSKTAAYYCLKPYGKEMKPLRSILSIGRATSSAISAQGFKVDHEVTPSTQEGIIKYLQGLDLSCEKVVFPHSSLSRGLVDSYFIRSNIKYNSFPLYKTIFNKYFTKPELTDFNAVYFSSPSCIKMFLKCYNSIPIYLNIYCIGEVTYSYLNQILNNKENKVIII